MGRKSQPLTKRKIHAQIRSRRIAAGLTQAELGLRVKRHRTCVVQWESGRTAPNWRIESVIASVLKCTVQELRGDQAGV